MPTKCPKGDHAAYRLYAQVTSPTTGHSTNVTVAAVLCATLSTREIAGRQVGVYSVERDQHGIVAVDKATFQVARRQTAHAATRVHPEWAAKKAKARVAAPAKPKGPTHAPKAKKAATAPGRAATATRKSAPRPHPAAPAKGSAAPTPPAPVDSSAAQATTLTDAGKALLKGAGVK